MFLQQNLQKTFFQLDVRAKQQRMQRVRVKPLAGDQKQPIDPQQIAIAKIEQFCDEIYFLTRQNR